MAEQNPQITLRVSPDLYEWLDARFRRSRRRHLSEIVREILERGRRATEADEAANPPPVAP